MEPTQMQRLELQLLNRLARELGKVMLDTGGRYFLRKSTKNHDPSAYIDLQLGTGLAPAVQRLATLAGVIAPDTSRKTVEI